MHWRFYLYISLFVSSSLPPSLELWLARSLHAQQTNFRSCGLPAPSRAQASRIRISVLPDKVREMPDKVRELPNKVRRLKRAPCGSFRCCSFGTLACHSLVPPTPYHPPCPPRPRFVIFGSCVGFVGVWGGGSSLSSGLWGGRAPRIWRGVSGGRQRARDSAELHIFGGPSLPPSPRGGWGSTAATGRS